VSGESLSASHVSLLGEPPFGGVADSDPDGDVLGENSSHGSSRHSSDSFYGAYFTQSSNPYASFLPASEHLDRPTARFAGVAVQESTPRHHSAQYYNDRLFQGRAVYLGRFGTPIHAYNDANFATSRAASAAGYPGSDDSDSEVPDLVYYPPDDPSDDDADGDIGRGYHRYPLARPQHHRLPTSQRVSNYFLTHDGEIVRAALGDPDSVLEIPYCQDDDPFATVHTDVPDYREPPTTYVQLPNEHSATVQANVTQLMEAAAVRNWQAASTGLPALQRMHDEIESLSNQMDTLTIGSRALVDRGANNAILVPHNLDRDVDTTLDLTEDEINPDFW
jgi:hypothetical protein